LIICSEHHVGWGGLSYETTRRVRTAHLTTRRVRTAHLTTRRVRTAHLTTCSALCTLLLVVHCAPTTRSALCTYYS